MKATDHGSRGHPHHWLRRLGALVCLAGLGLNAQAASTTTLSEQLTGWSPNPGGGWYRNAYNERNAAAVAANRSWAGAGAGASARVIATDVASIAGRAGSLPVASSMAVGIGDAAGAVARCMFGGGVICGAASAAAAAYAAYRVYNDYDGSDGLMGDPGTATTSTTSPGWRSASGYPATCPITGSAEAAARCGLRVQHGIADSALANCYMSSPGTVSQGWKCTYVPNGNLLSTSITAQTYTATQCPASIDALNPAYNIPAGSPIGPDGKCPTARYNHAPISAADAAARVTANPPADPTPWVQPTKDAIQSGGQSAPAGITTTGPASQTGTGTTTTTTGGSPSQTVTQTSTPTYTYNYAGDTITYNTSITTVTNNITTGTTTTTTTDGPTAIPQDPTDPCTADPNRIGCLKLGDTPTDQVPTKDRQISYSAEAVGLPSGCPAPTTVAGHTVSYDAICDAATGARPWVIVGAVFSALMLMLAGVRQI